MVSLQSVSDLVKGNFLPNCVPLLALSVFVQLFEPDTCRRVPKEILTQDLLP